jgi:hypothetical protein
MLRFNVRNGVRFVVAVAALAVATFVPVLAQAAFITVGSEVFSDGFSGSSLGSAWNAWLKNGGTIGVDGAGLLTINTATAEGAAELYNPNSTLNFSAMPNDWAAEVKFKMTGALSSNNDNGGGNQKRQWVVLNGNANDEASALGFDLRAMQNTDNTFDLAWYGWDNVDETRAAETLLTGLSKDQFYRVVAHRKTDGNVDIYLGVGDGLGVGDVDCTLIATKAVIGASNPGILCAGDLSTVAIHGTEVIDSIKIGSCTIITPEPSSIVILSTSLLGLLAYAWRKRK